MSTNNPDEAPVEVTQLIYCHITHRAIFELHRRDSDQHFNLLKRDGDSRVWLWDWETGIHGHQPTDPTDAINLSIRWIGEETHA